MQHGHQNKHEFKEARIPANHSWSLEVGNSSTNSRERNADVHINIFADALCIAQHPHNYNTVPSAGVPLQFSDALL